MNHFKVMISNDYYIKGKYIEVDLKSRTYICGRSASSSDSLLDISVTTNKQVDDLQIILDKNGFIKKEKEGVNKLWIIGVGLGA